MWKCLNCSEAVDDRFEVCWNCEADRRGVLPNGTSSSSEANGDNDLKRFLNKKHESKNCSACQSELKFIGTKEFHEGANWGALGELGELFVGRTNLEMHVCPTCLRVEFFVSDLLV